MRLNSTWQWSIICGLLLIALSQTAAQAQDYALPQPKSMTVDRSLSPADAAQMIRTARLFYAFWDTGNAEYASAAVDNDFRDNTLPEGRPQGLKGLLYASQTFRTAVPDLHCAIEDLLVSGDKVTARLLFTGPHKGEFMGHPATGKPVKFFAIDILRIRGGKIVEDWHLEDNLTLLKQLGVVSLKK
ncbi:MAG TPA: ester cyclase [Blastocatellia bacterium]|nr:ester cyclase [Blastocatellia bacterium]